MNSEFVLDCPKDKADDQNENSKLEYNRFGFYSGSQFEEDENRIPLEIYRKREMKWANMLKNWDAWSTKKNKLREKCRKGIPDSFRSEVWQRLCNSPMTSVNNLQISPPKPKGIVQRPSLMNSVVGSSLSLRSDKRFRQSQYFTSNTSRFGKSETEVISTYGTEGRKKKKNLSMSTDGIPPIGKEHQVKGSFSLLLRKLSIRREQHKQHIEEKQIDSSTSSSSGYQSKNNQHPGIPLTIQEALCPRTENHYSSDSNQIGSTYSTPYSSLGSSKNYDQFVSAYDPKNRLSPFLHSSGVDSSLEDREPSSTSYLWITGQSCDSSEKLKIDQISNDNNNRLQSSVSLASMESDISINNYYFPNKTKLPNNDVILKKSRTKGSTLVAAENDQEADPVLLYNYYREQTPTKANIDQIDKDIERQFPFHHLFASKEKFGQTILRNILSAYTVRNQKDDYCQGQAPIAAVLIMYMPEVNAFWAFSQICEHYLQNYFSDGLDILSIDGQVLFGLLATVEKPIYKYLTKLDVFPSLIMIDWFMCVYSRTLPWECFLRVLDMFLCEGKIILYKVGIVLLRRCFPTREIRTQHPEMCDALQRIQDFPVSIKDTDSFIADVINCPLTFSMVARETKIQSQKYFNKKDKQ